MLDPTKSKVSVLAKKYENEEASGINIEVAKQVLREEDKFDKERFRAKIREKHREERRKMKAQKKKDDSDEEPEPEAEDDEYYNKSEGDESDGPDLSWLPDPDKIYGPKKDSSAEESNEELDDSEIEQHIHKPSKRKLITQEEVKLERHKKRKTIENNDLLATEELALHLLHN